MACFIKIDVTIQQIEDEPEEEPEEPTEDDSEDKDDDSEDKEEAVDEDDDETVRTLNTLWRHKESAVKNSDVRSCSSGCFYNCNFVFAGKNRQRRTVKH